MKNIKHPSKNSVKKITLKEQLENELGEWLCQQGLSILNEDCDTLINRCMRVIQKEMRVSSKKEVMRGKR